ncbi:pyroglutamyl peptidase type I [Venturia nashicola]|uniref:Pyroglutamyl peptidase type I n=1 Tax=Venturia nashicola TaxID=86259 RepID=A0A4Z1NF46_9PEZI|nr:pyroglutamyl peptidase type I [Venturia nashicola]
MGDSGVQIPLSGVEDGEEKEVTVLVTGYGPFLNQVPINPSWSITSILPETIQATSTSPKIRLIKYPHPIRVAYQTVLDLVPKLLTPGEDQIQPEIILHIGLAASRPFYALECQSPRSPYWTGRDVDNQVFSQEKTNQLWPLAEFPQFLKPTFDINDVFARWQSHLSNSKLDIRRSSDPGNFLCGFIYYTSMSWFWRKQAEERPVMFLHVPLLTGEEEVEEGKGVAIGLIRALVESRADLGVRDPLKGRIDENDGPMDAAEVPMEKENYKGWDGVS